MKVLLSIKPEFAESILEGEKRFEFRKTIFRNKDVKTVVIYATMPVGKVIGEFDIADILSSEPSDLWKATKKYAGITRCFFDEYFAEKNKAFAIVVKDPKRYDKPLHLSELLPGAVPPQSFRYI
ncbi:ASCH domain-containing protein [Salmonella enterica]|uniref:ASCH domain-containing protein n=3 Tax=Salmonella enterica I TaxID=59201 RepID=A0A6Y5CFR9_SALDE|nr:ASCH domain-containing protein [Salmonella enterica]EAY2108468.1 ASCH domain-containing protein [Salmonella enterica subsp. enterica serovar Typhimurium]EBA0748844.1 ASCH domain-containing protein [Salmonella enterica subsp. enterica]EBC9936411.1 ASCH domain-containing protein [Salmonella enterica subsp. enterica serovar Nigeria]EBD2227790.1 ASCH domain-containing protein [Salmonella enterica subsp. enterica serovar Lexington]EBJ7217116.1 ASCH domain-containing protein [Salmonella enterica 